MARYNQKRKRSSGPSFRRFKKRKTGFKRRSAVRQGRPSDGIVAAVPYRTRRISRRAYKHKLWEYTSMLPKYRSYLGRTSTITTPANNTDFTVNTTFLLQGTTGAAAPFYTTAGGLQNMDAGVTGVFKSSIVLRGGSTLITVYNDTETGDVNNDNVEMIIAIIKCSDAFDNTVLSSTQPSAHGIDYTPEFRRQVGRVVAQRRWLLKDGENQSLGFRYPIQKIDAGDYAVEKKMYALYLAVRNGFGASAQACHFKWQHDLTFTGDLIS